MKWETTTVNDLHINDYVTIIEYHISTLECRARTGFVTHISMSDSHYTLNIDFDAADVEQICIDFAQWNRDIVVMRLSKN